MGKRQSSSGNHDSYETNQLGEAIENSSSQWHECNSSCCFTCMERKEQNHRKRITEVSEAPAGSHQNPHRLKFFLDF
jgi:hypothetical protein